MEGGVVGRKKKRSNQAAGWEWYVIKKKSQYKLGRNNKRLN